MEASRRYVNPRSARKARTCARDTVEERPDDTVVAELPRPRQQRDARAAAAREQVRLENVVFLVRRRDARRAELPRHLVERLVAHVPRAGLRRQTQRARRGPGVPAAGHEGQVQPPRVLLGKVEIPVGLAAPPAVVHVPDGQPPGGPGRRFRGPVEQGRRVRASGNGEQNRRAPGEQSRRRGALEGGADRVRLHTPMIDPPRADRFLHGSDEMRNRCAGLLVFAILCGSASADTVAVKHSEGLVHGFLALRTLTGETIADGDLIQTTKAGQVTSRLIFRFRDGSLHDETVVFTQDGTFRLVRDHLVQRGPSFSMAIDATLDGASGDLQVRYKDDKGVEKLVKEKLELPPGTANGLVFTLLKNIAPTTPETRIPMVAAGPKPRVVTLLVVPAGEDSFQIGSLVRKATHYVVKVKIGGIAGVVAPLIGKQPPDSHVWILQGDGAPAFVKSEGPLAPDGPVWRIELASPTWPAPAGAKPTPR